MNVRVILPRLILALALAAAIVWALLNRSPWHAGNLQMQIYNLLASLVAMIPGTVAYTWLGHAGREVATGSEAAVRNLFPAFGLLALVGFLPRLVRRFWRSGPRWVGVAELSAQLARGDDLVVVDVRGPDEFSGPLGHIPVARNIPLSDLPTRLKELESEKHRRVTLVCRTDKRSAKAADLLQKSGFADVAVLRGGMDQWNRQALLTALEANASRQH